MQAFRILILSDGRPGHYHLAEGIAAAVGRLRPVAVTKVDVHRGRWPGSLAATLANAGWAERRVLKLLSGRDEHEFPPADLIVSAGAETLAPNVVLARHRGLPNIFYGSLRRFRPQDFALVLTSYARNATRPRHALALKPSAADPDQVRPASAAGPGAPLRLMGLLVGGDSGSFRYAEADWQGLLDLIAASHQATGLRWLVSNSRRTSARFSDEAARLASAPQGPIARFIDVRQAGAGTLGEIFARADAVLVTDDSSSMISEAIWMRLPVLGAVPGNGSHTGDEAIYRTWLADHGWCRRVAIADLDPQRLAAELSRLTPLTENPLDELAALIAGRLPQLKPPPS